MKRYTLVKNLETELIKDKMTNLWEKIAPLMEKYLIQKRKLQAIDAQMFADIYDIIENTDEPLTVKEITNIYNKTHAESISWQAISNNIRNIGNFYDGYISNRMYSCVSCHNTDIPEEVKNKVANFNSTIHRTKKLATTIKRYVEVDENGNIISPKVITKKYKRYQNIYSKKA